MAKIRTNTVMNDFEGKQLLADTNVSAVMKFLQERMLPLIPQDQVKSVLDDFNKLSEPLTLKKMVYAAVGTGRQGFTSEESVELYMIASKFAGDPDEVDLESKQITLLRRAIEQHYVSPLHIGRARDVLEAKAELSSVAPAKSAKK